MKCCLQKDLAKNTGSKCSFSNLVCRYFSVVVVAAVAGTVAVAETVAASPLMLVPSVVLEVTVLDLCVICSRWRDDRGTKKQRRTVQQSWPVVGRYPAGTQEGLYLCLISVCCLLHWRRWQR